MKIVIASAWPYANGSLHIGHVASLLPADVIARYYRLKGDDVYFVSGSDCHGTPVAIRAKQEGRTPEQISDFYHNEFCECFNSLGFTYDLYGKTSQKEHVDFIQAFHKKMYEGNYIYEKQTPQAYCEICKTFLADRFVLGNCPACGEPARGDQCDSCGMVLEPEQLRNPQCSVCGSEPVFKETKHLFIAISKLEKQLKHFVDKHPQWRKNAIAFSNKYINEGLRDRAITRDLDWGIPVPKVGYDCKKIYIWAENVLGYLSMSKVVCEARGESFGDLWGDGEDIRHYYTHGKDNIPFHTIILPSLLLANGGNWRLPDSIISSEYLTLEGRKISTSLNWAIWVKDIVNKYNPDSIRYFLIANGPEKRDTDFSWREFINSHNGELLGAYGNFVNRTIAFVYKYLGGVLPVGVEDEQIHNKLIDAYRVTGENIESGNLKDGLEHVFELIRFANKYFDAKKPWQTRENDLDCCKTTIYNCVQIIGNLSILLEPFLPFSTKKIRKWLGVENSWGFKEIPHGILIEEPQILFDRIHKNVIDEEVNMLKEGRGDL